MNGPIEGELVQIEMAGAIQTVVFIQGPRSWRNLDVNICTFCALYKDPACAETECSNGLFLTEERYALAKLLGVENLEPT